jgi:hypothetical protein
VGFRQAAEPCHVNGGLDVSSWAAASRSLWWNCGKRRSGEAAAILSLRIVNSGHNKSICHDALSLHVITLTSPTPLRDTGIDDCNLQAAHGGPEALAD